jgi:probable HAF family extracellular repeat protein
VEDFIHEAVSLRLRGLGLLVSLTGPAQAQYDYTTLDVPGALRTYANGINASGQIVGYYVDAGGTYHGFLLDVDGSYTTIDPPAARETNANGGLECLEPIPTGVARARRKQCQAGTSAVIYEDRRFSSRCKTMLEFCAAMLNAAMREASWSRDR